MPTLSRLEPTDGATVFLLRFSDPEDTDAAPENSLTDDFLDSLSGILDEVEGSTGPAALVTVGAGKFFSTGLDLEFVTSGADLGPYLTRVHALFARILRLDMPTVAAINGHAFGAGAMLAVCHDVRYMRADRGFWNLPEARLGMDIPRPMAELLMSRLGRGTASTAMTTAHRYTAAEAVSVGIVDEELDRDAVLDTAVEKAASLAALRGPHLAQIRSELVRDLLPLLDAPARP